MLSFFAVDAQKKKKKKTVKRAKTSKVAAISSPAPVVSEPVVAPVVAESEPEEPEVIPNSLTVLNAKSPSSFRKYRDIGLIKKGDSMVSVRTTPIDYGFIEDKDILRSIVVWEIIDMNEKINQPFYYNSDGLVSSNRSLYQILIDGVNNGEIKEVYDDEFFQTKLNKEQIIQRTKRVKESDYLIEQKNSGVKLTEQDLKAGTDIFETKTESVKLLKIKGMWYIDRRDGQMKYRLLGISAMGPDPQTLGEAFVDKNELIDLFWIYYPSSREIMANNIVFNPKNLSSDITFDDVLNARRFSSVIFRSESGFGSGVIKDYIPNDAEGQLEENDRIKAQILEMENDMWNY